MPYQPMIPCGSTEVHDPHPYDIGSAYAAGQCPGLDAEQVAEAAAMAERAVAALNAAKDLPPTDPLRYRCEECLAPPGEFCRTTYDTPHDGRVRAAQLRTLEQGTCTDCGRWMVRGSVLDAPVDAWHPEPDAAAACPAFPHPHQNWEQYAAMVNLGLTPGHPGVEKFQPVPEAADVP